MFNILCLEHVKLKLILVIYYKIYFRQLLDLFINPEIIKWSSLCNSYEKMLRTTPYFDSADEKGKERWTQLKNRVVEHVSLYNII